MNDNYSQWLKHQEEQDEFLSMCPKCHECGEPIQTQIIIKFKGYELCSDCAKYIHGIELERQIF